MGAIKNWLIENQENEHLLARALELDWDEISQLSWEIDTNESKEGLIYNYIINFDLENSSPDILQKINRLENNGTTVILEPWELDSQYDYDEQFDAIVEDKNNIEKFLNEINNLRGLNNVDIQGLDDEMRRILNRQIFIGVIGTMETYFSETFINLTSDYEVFFKNFVQSHPEFKQRKIELSEIFREKEKLNENVKKTIFDTIFHNLPIVNNMLRDTFEITVPEIGEIYKDVLKRHDLVHRNGLTKEGEEIVVSTEIIGNLIDRMRTFILTIEEKIVEKIATLLRYDGI